MLTPADVPGAEALPDPDEEFTTRIERGDVLTAEQWKRALVSTGALRVRERWPAGVPFAVSAREPEWLWHMAVHFASTGPELGAFDVGARRRANPWPNTVTVRAKRAAGLKGLRPVMERLDSHDVGVRQSQVRSDREKVIEPKQPPSKAS